MPTEVTSEIETPITPADVTPAKTATETVAPTIEELQKKLAEAEQRAANKTDEAARHFKKVEAFEKAEAKRAEAALTKEQLMEKRTKEAEATAAQIKATTEANLAKVTSDAETKLLKAAFLLKAKDLGFENPADAFILADKNVTKNADGDFDEASIEAALKPLIGRLPIKAQGDGKGTPKTPQAQKPKKSESTGRTFFGKF